MKKTLCSLFSGLLIVCICLAFIPFSAKVTAEEIEESFSVATFSELKQALSSSATKKTIDITDDITVTETLAFSNEITVNANEHTLTLDGGFIDLKNGSKTVFHDIEIVKPESNDKAYAVYFRDNPKQGTCYFYNSKISVGSGSALCSLSVNGNFYADDTVITGGDYSVKKGNLFVSGDSTFETIEATTFVYDFRNCKVIATVNEENGTNRVGFTIDNKPFYHKGNSEDTAKFNVDIYYTLDGTDPVTSETRILFEKERTISLAVDRVIKVAVSSSAAYSIENFVFTYDVNEDKTEGNILSVLNPETIRVKCASVLTADMLPECVKITLEDGRELYAIAEWDLSSVDLSVSGEYKVETPLIAPYFVTNTKNIKAEVIVEVYYEEIANFVFTPNNVFEEGKNTALKGYVLGEFSCTGGNEKEYDFNFVDDGYCGSTEYFKIENNKLILTKTLLNDTYFLSVSATSCGKTGVLQFEINVNERSYVKTIGSNPYEGIDWETVNFVTTAQHNHTFYSSGNFEFSEHNDSAFDTVAERLDAYKKYGYGAVIFTEHDYVTLDYIGGSLPNGYEDILTIYGNELSKSHDILFYGMKAFYDKKGQGASNSNGVEGNIELISQMNGDGIVYLAHPKRINTDKDYWYNLFDKYDVIYGMEVFNAGQAARNFSEEIWDYILTKSMPERPIWGSASDDAHSKGAIATGWTTFLLSDEQMNSRGVFDTLQNGNYTLSTICINPETDEDIMRDDITGPLPIFTSIIADKENGTITVTAENYHTIEWVSANGKVVSTDTTININEKYGVDKYIRCRLYGDNGMTHSQPIAIETSNEIWQGVLEEPFDNIDNPPIDDGNDNNGGNNGGNDDVVPPSNENKGCGSMLVMQDGLLLLSALSVVVVFAIKRIKRKVK